MEAEKLKEEQEKRQKEWFDKVTKQTQERQAAGLAEEKAGDAEDRPVDVNEIKTEIATPQKPVNTKTSMVNQVSPDKPLDTENDVEECTNFEELD